MQFISTTAEKTLRVAGILKFTCPDRSLGDKGPNDINTFLDKTSPAVGRL